MKLKGFLFQHEVLFGILIVLAVWFILYLLLVIIFRPSHDRDWELGHEKLPKFIFSATSSQVVINNYRDFNWLAEKEAEATYKTRTFAFDSVTGLDVFISHFDDFEGLAHIFLSFTLEGDNPIVVSLETRREEGEAFSPILGILRQFEIIYVVGSEEDIVGVRTGHRNERVYLYPTKASSEQAKKLLELISTEVNEVYDKPRMYNTLTHNCTNELTRLVEKMSDVKFPITWKTVLPGYFDEVLYGLGLIGTDGTFEEIKNRHLINNDEVAQMTKENSSFSDSIRASIEK